MVICKYFLNNSCKYGSSCRFDHYRESGNRYDEPQRSRGSGVSVFLRTQQSNSNYRPQSDDYNGKYDQRYQQNHYGFRQHSEQNYSSRNDKHHWYNSSRQSDQSPDRSNFEERSGRKNGEDAVSLQEVKEMMYALSEMIEHSKMWPLTCVGLIGGYGNVPGWEDYSTEEIRYETYAASKSGEMASYQSRYRELLNKAKQERLLYIAKSKKADEILSSYLRQRSDQMGMELVKSSTGSDPASTFSFAANLGAVQSTPSLFGSLRQPQPFNLPAQRTVFSQPMQQSIFNPPAQQSAAYTNFSFAGATSGQPAFGSALPKPSMFADAAQSSFGGSSMVPPSTFPGFATSTFGSSAAASPLTSNAGSALYTPLPDLKLEELQAFKSSEFEFGKIPLVPPPIELI